MMTGLHPRRISRPALALFLPAIAQFMLHLLFSAGYGLSGDELYAIACSNAPAAGYVDLAPVPVLLLALQRMIGGDALIAIRFVPAVIAAVAVYFTGLIARRMGAGAYGQFLAALCALIAPALLVAGHVATPFGSAVLWWTIGTYVLVRLLQESSRLRWILLGLVSGAGLLSSFSMAFFVVAAFVAVVLTPLRKQLLTIWPWAAAATAVVMMIPWALWQWTHAWPTIEWIRVVYVRHAAAMPLLDVLFDQVKLLQPLTIVVWLPALGALCFARPFGPWRAIAWMYLAAAILMIAVAMEPHYLVPAATGLFAAGAVLVEKVLARTWMRVTAAVMLVLAGVATLPMGLPVLSPRTFIDYEKMSGFRMTMGNTECTDRLPGYYGTMFGRKELATVLKAVFTTMAPEERGRFGIFCETAEQAASLDFYGKDHNLPPAVSGDRQYWYRGPGGYTGDRLVVVGVNEEGLRMFFREVHLRMRFRDEYLHPGNGMTPVWLVGEPAQPLEKVWGQLWTIR